MKQDWNSYPRQVLVWFIQDWQLPIAASPSRQLKATLVEALERYEIRWLNPLSAETTIEASVLKHKMAQLMEEYARKKMR